MLLQLADEAALRIWRRHQQRRCDALPTISLLIAGPGELDALEATFEAAGLTLVRSAGTDAHALLHDFWVGLSHECDVIDEAFAFVARALEQPEQELRAAWSARSERERRRWLERCAGEATPVLQAALESLGGALPPSDDVPSDDATSLRALLRWLPRRAQFALCLAPAGPAGLRSLLALAQSAPHWPLLAAVDRKHWPSVREHLNDRERAQLEAGRLPAPRSAIGPPPAAAEAGATEIAADFARASAHDAAPGGEPQAPEPSPHTAREPDTQQPPAATRPGARLPLADSSNPYSERAAQEARSEAERRLWRLLEADSITRGLFKLNRAMPFHFGPRKAEVDFACFELRLALEVDGFYHFHQPDAYRRDRRKDVLLQHQGYLVSRHLASDVFEREGEVVRSIRELVLRRRRSLRREKAK